MPTDSGSGSQSFILSVETLQRKLKLILPHRRHAKKLTIRGKMF